MLMGKTENLIDTAVVRTGNTIATPLRRWGEVANAATNILRQGKSSTKNTAEVSKQTIDSLVDNFLNFSKVDGKRYQRLGKGTINLASAVTWRPFMIIGAWVLSGLNQWVRKPFQKLLYTPEKMFKGMRNATRIFSKKKEFDFVKYDTHETGWDTWINQITEKRLGFLGKASSSPNKTEKKEEKKLPKKTAKNIEKKEQAKPIKPVEMPINSTEEPQEEKTGFQQAIKNKDDDFINKELANRWYGPGGSLKTPTKEKATSIPEIKQQFQKEAQAKKNAEIESKKRKNLGKEEKEMYKKEFTNLLENDLSEKGVLARAKKNNKGNDMETILKTLDKEYPTFATFIDDEILAKNAPA